MEPAVRAGPGRPAWERGQAKSKPENTLEFLSMFGIELQGMQRLISAIGSPIVVLLRLLCFYVVLGNPLGSRDKTLRPFVSIDLPTLGYVTPTAERDVRAYSFLKYSVAFLDDGTLAVSFLKKNDHPGLSRRDGTPGSGFVFHTVLIDPLSGRVGGQHTWGNAGYWNSLLPLENGSFFIQSNESLTIYSKEVRQIVSKKLEGPGDLLPRYSVSPSGHSLYELQDAYDAKRTWLTTISLLDTVTLKRKQSKLTPGHADETGSDAQVVYSVANPKNELLLFVYNTDGSSTAWSPRLLNKDSATANLLSRSGCKSTTFINNSVLAVTGDCPFLILLQSDKKIAEIYSPEYRFGGEIQPSRNGRRFAFVRSQTNGGSSRITNIELCVYDLEERAEVFAASVVPLPQLKLAFAISPDGSLLAMQTDSLLRIWRLAP
jgi:hypothetical protein